MQDKIIIKAAESLAGKNGVLLVEFLKGKKDVNEFNIAKKLNMTINQARNIIYKLHSKNIINSTRKKDKRKGWYIYFWTLDNLKALELAKILVEKEIYNQEHLSKSRENKRFYKCSTCGIEMTEETALNYEFTCQECGTLLLLNEDKSKILEIQSKLEKLKRELKIINFETYKLREEGSKKALKKAEKEKKIKKLEREKAKKKLKAKEKREKNKSNKKSNKKGKK